MDERLKQAIRPDTTSIQNLRALRVRDGLGCGDVAGVDAQTVAVAGDVVIGRIVERAGLGADAVQAGDGRVVGGREDAALVVDADAAERGPGALVVLGDIERAGLNGRQIPGVGVELLVDTGGAVAVVLLDRGEDVLNGQAGHLCDLLEGVSLPAPALGDALLDVFGQLVEDAVLEVGADEPVGVGVAVLAVLGAAGLHVFVEALGGQGVHVFIENRRCSTRTAIQLRIV